MKSPQKITIKKIFSFIEGNTNMFADRVGFYPQHLKEQIAYRALLCKDDCVVDGECKHCKCSLPGKFFVVESCNDGERFPNLMSKQKWEEYKKENNIVM